MNQEPWWTADYRGGIDSPRCSSMTPEFAVGVTRVENSRSVPWFGIAAIVGIGAFLIYGISRASKSSERFNGPIQRRAGKLAAKVIRARAGGLGETRLGKSFDNSSSLPLESRIVRAKLLSE